jgi:hypothetical protein
MKVRARSQFHPQFEQLESRLALATLTITPPAFSDPGSGDIVQQITLATRPGLTTARAHTGSVVQWSLADAADGLAAALASASAAPFTASGSITEVTFHGNHRLGPVEGSATQIGTFTGNIDARVTRLGADETATGTLTLVSPEGDTLTLSFDIVRVRGTGSFVGSYVVTGGSGRFADASGEGQMTLTPQPDGTAEFTLDGSLANSAQAESQELQASAIGSSFYYGRYDHGRYRGGW